MQIAQLVKWAGEMRFGMPDGDRKTQRDIVKLFGIFKRT